MSDKQGLVFSAEDLLKEYDALPKQQAARLLPREAEQQMADTIARVMSAEIAKNESNPRALVLGTSAALLAMSVQNVNLTAALAKSIQEGEIAMIYGISAAKREAFMIGGWVLFVCATIAKFAGVL